MVTSKKIATDISAASEAFLVSLNKALLDAKAECSPQEYEQFKKAVGAVVGGLELDMLWPLYKKHPELQPENLRNWKDET